MAKEDNLLKGHKPTQFSSERQPANAGRPPSFKNAYKEILGEAGSIIWVDQDRLLERTTQDGIKQVGLQLNKVQTLLSRLDRMATGKNEKLAFDVIRFLWEQMDGKAAQPLTGDKDNPLVLNMTSNEVAAEVAKYKRLLEGGE